MSNAHSKIMYQIEVSYPGPNGVLDHKTDDVYEDLMDANKAALYMSYVRQVLPSCVRVPSAPEAQRNLASLANNAQHIGPSLLDNGELQILKENGEVLKNLVMKDLVLEDQPYELFVAYYLIGEQRENSERYGVLWQVAEPNEVPDGEWPIVHEVVVKEVHFHPKQRA